MKTINGVVIPPKKELIQQLLFKRSLIEKIRHNIHTLKSKFIEIEEKFKLHRKAVNLAEQEVNNCQDEIIRLSQPDLFQKQTPEICKDEDEEIEIDDSIFEESEILDFIRHKFGKKAALEIAREFSGCSVYISKSLLTKINYDLIRTEYREGADYKALAIKYEYSESHIRNIIHKK